MGRSSLVAACLLLSACSSSLEEHEALWATRGPSSYRYTYATGGSALHVQLRVTVESRAVSSTVVLSPPTLSGVQGSTVEQLFEDIRSRLQSSCKTTVHYDESLGYPLSTYSDCNEEGDSWAVTELAPGQVPDGGTR